MGQQVGGPPHIPVASFGDWSQMDPAAKAAAQSQWDSNRQAATAYNQQMFDHYRQLEQMPPSGPLPTAPDTGFVPSTDAGVAGGNVGPGGVNAPGGGATAEGRPGLGLGLGLNRGQQAGFQAAAQSGGAQGSAEWLASHPQVQRRIANMKPGAKGSRVEEFMQTGATQGRVDPSKRPYMDAQRRGR